jgi:hypothetical protein
MPPLTQDIAAKLKLVITADIESAMSDLHYLRPERAMSPNSTSSQGISTPT